MRYYIYLAAVCLLVLIPAGVTAASGTSLGLPVPSSFRLSGTAVAIDSDSNELAPGNSVIEFFQGDPGLYIRVPMPANNGTWLVSLDDPESSIFFVNNTMQIPVYSADDRVGNLIVTTENLLAGRDDYSGLVTGLELDTAGLTSGNFTASASLFLQSLPADVECSMSPVDIDTLGERISADLEASELAVAELSPCLSLEGDTDVSRDAVSSVIVTVQVDDGWSQQYDDSNVTLYRYYDNNLSRLELRSLKDGDNTVYQAITPGLGQYVLVAAKTLDRAIEITEETRPALAGDMAVLGVVLAVLIFALGIMVGRVTKR